MSDSLEVVASLVLLLCYRKKVHCIAWQILQDGKPDYRMRFDSADGCGTFYRNPLEGDLIATLLPFLMPSNSVSKADGAVEQ